MRSGRRHPFAGKCFRYLGADHFASACRDHIRCILCSRTGHKAFQCTLKSIGGINNMLRAHHAYGRASVIPSSFPIWRITMHVESFATMLYLPILFNRQTSGTRHNKQSLMRLRGGLVTIRLTSSWRDTAITILQCSCRRGFRRRDLSGGGLLP